MDAPAAYKAVEIPGVLQYQGQPHRLLTLASSDPLRLAAMVDMARNRGWADYVEGTDTATGDPSIWMLKPTA